jgi:hypothetical protein
VVEKYSLRKIRALYRAAADNMDIEMKLFSKEVGIGVRYGMAAKEEDFNRWLRE